MQCDSHPSLLQLLPSKINHVLKHNCHFLKIIILSLIVTSLLVLFFIGTLSQYFGFRLIFLTTPFSITLNVPFLIYKFPKELFLSFFSEFFISDVTKKNYHLSGDDSLYFLGNMTYFLSPLHLQPPLQYIYF